MTIPQNDAKRAGWLGAWTFGFLVLWLIGSPLVLFALERSGWQSWVRWLDNFDTAILLVALGFVWWLEKRLGGNSNVEEE